MPAAGVKALALSMDAASQHRLARSCEQVGYFPKVMPYPLSVGNEKQFFGTSWLGNAYVPMNHFPWMGDSTPAEKYWQATFHARAFLLFTVRGSLRLLTGQAVIAAGEGQAEGAADANSVSTGLRARDRHLRHRHYLNAPGHPRSPW